MSIKEELIGAELVNQNTDEEVAKVLVKSHEILDKLDPMQQAILESINALGANSALFLEDGTFTVPEGIRKVLVTGCASGTVVYAGEYVVNEPIAVTPGDKIQIKVGLDKNTEMGELLFLTKGTISESVNSDFLKCGHTLGTVGKSGNLPSGYGYNSFIGKPGTGGYGGAFGAGGGGVGIGGNGNGNGTASYGGQGGSPGGLQQFTFKMHSNTMLFKPASAGTAGETGIGRQRGGKGGNGGNAGGFGAGGGQGGSGGNNPDGTTTYTSGNDGQGTQGFLLIKWGVTAA